MDSRSQITNLVLSPVYRLTSAGNRFRRQATAPVGPAEVARSASSAAAQSPRSGFGPGSPSG
eukprot:8958930-Alexandrium_andersonii.AAC.1